MAALDPIDVMRVKTGYYSSLPGDARERFPIPVVLFWDGSGAADARASREAFELELRDRLQSEFPDAIEIEITCADGEQPRASLTEVSLTRSSEERLIIARRWVDALVTLTWAHGHWLAPRESG